jgi:PAS domain S-box-containing protein
MAIRIVLADDSQIVRQGLRSLLEREADLEVVAEAGNGTSAVQMVREFSPDLIIIDATMPKCHGAEAVQQILTASPGVKMIALSMYADRRFVVNMLKAGASAYLLKDCAFEELAQAIRVVLNNKTYVSPGVSDVVIQDYMETLRESEARFKSIFEGATIGIALVDRDGRIVESNPALQEMLGISRAQLRGRAFTEFAPQGEVDRCQGLFQDLAGGKRGRSSMEKQIQRQDGSLMWARLHLSPFKGAGGELQYFIGMVEDITDRRQAEEEIRTYQEQLRSLTSELSLTEERERRRLATELHDHVGQILALAQIKLGALKESASSTNLTAPMDEIRRLIEQTIQYTRSLTFELSPPILYDLGFEAAVEWLAELIQNQHGMRIEVQLDQKPKPMDDELRVLLFQAVRELLVNVVKHAQATRVAVSITREDQNMLIQVKDDGVGLEVAEGASARRPGGFGLFSIRERLKYLGGHLEMVSQPGQGTQVTLVVPLKY